MKRYFIFAFNAYHPVGGMGDFMGARCTLREAVSGAENITDLWDYVEVWDMEKIEKVWNKEPNKDKPYEGIVSFILGLKEEESL